jgi:hypothetical protein
MKVTQTPLRKMSDALRQYAIAHGSPGFWMQDNEAGVKMHSMILSRGWTIQELAKRAKRSSQRTKLC